MPADSIWLEGRLVFPDGTPLDEEVVVVARGRRFAGGDGGQRYRAAVAADGSFRVAFAASTRTARVEIEARFLYLEEILNLDAREPPAVLVIEPMLGGRVKGRALAPESGEAPDFASGSVGWRPALGMYGHQLAADGSFELGPVPPTEDGELDVVVPGLVDASVAPLVVRPGETTEVEVALSRGARVSGRVVGAEGEGLEGAELELFIESDGGFRRGSGRSEAGGRFDLRGLPPGSMEVAVEHAGHLRLHRGLGTLADGQAFEGIELRLERGEAIEGVVLWPDGRPAKSAEIELVHADSEAPMRLVGHEPDRMRHEMVEHPAGTTDAEGRFRVGGLLLREFTVRASAQPADDERPRRARAPWIARAEKVRPGGGELRLVLESGAAVRGRVVDELGRPVEEFRIAASSAREDARYGSRSTSFRSADGSFALEGLEAGPWLLSARGGERDRFQSLDVRVDVPRAAPIEIVASRGARLEGRVVAPDDGPVAGAEVEITRSLEDLDAASLHRVLTDQAGKFVVERVTPDRFGLVARVDGRPSSLPLAIEVAAGETASGLELRLRPACRLTGEVHPAAGPPSGRTVRVQALAEHFFEQLETDASGRFELAGLAPGPYAVRLEPAGEMGRIDGDALTRYFRELVVQRVVLEPERVTHVVLGTGSADGWRVRGRVTDAGRPVAGAVLFWHAPGDRSAEAVTDPEGEYEVPLDGPGEWTVSVCWRSNEIVLLPVRVPDATDARVDLELPTGSISGTVRSLDGRGISGVDVLVLLEGPSGDERGWRGMSGARTDASGRYVLPKVAAGSYTLMAGDLGPWKAEEFQEAFGLGRVTGIGIETGEQRSGLDLVLRPAGSIEGTVLTPSCVPRTGARVDVLDAAGRSVIPWPAEVGPAGSFRVRGLPAGPLRVRASSTSGASVAHELLVEEGLTARLDLVLDP